MPLIIAMTKLKVKKVELKQRKMTLRVTKRDVHLEQFVVLK